jgi:hypothetical protein
MMRERFGLKQPNVDQLRKFARAAGTAATKYAPSALLAIGLGVTVGLVHNSIAQKESFSQVDQVQQSYQVYQKSYLNPQGYKAALEQQRSKTNQDPGENDSQTHSVPDAGSTAALLGLSVALVVLAQRRGVKQKLEAKP